MQIQVQNQQTKSPIHIRTIYQPFASTTKRRRLSLSNYAAKEPKNSDKKLINITANEKNTNEEDEKNMKIINKMNVTIANPSSIENNYIKIQAMREEERSRWRVNPKNLLAFFPTYTSLVDNQAHHLYLHKTVVTTKEEPISDTKCDLKIDQIFSQRQYNKLAPLRRVSKRERERRSQTKNSRGTLKNSFFNIEKLAIRPIIPNNTFSQDQRKNKISYTSELLTKEKALVLPRKYLDQLQKNQSTQNNQHTNTETENQTAYQMPSEAANDITQTATQIISAISLKTTNKFQVPTARAIKPFYPPFQRYFYFDFIWKVAYSNQLKAQFIENLPKKYKFYIGSGNNSMLIKTLLKRRQYWWAITDKIQQANFVWTQIKVTNIFNGQKNCQIPKPTQVQKESEQNGTLKKNIQIKRNYKILNKYHLQKWLKYYQKNKQIQQKLLPNFSKRNKIFKTSNLKSINTLQPQKIKIHNHLQRNYVLGNKKALFATMKKYYQVTKQQVFQFLPLTFHIENGFDDKEYFKFLQYFYKKDKESKQAQKGNKMPNIWIVKPGEFTNRGNGITVCKTLEEIKSIIKNKKKLDNGNSRTYIVQQYLDKPFLYCKRKFDIRHYMLITCVNGQLKGYWYQKGYIRTTSYEYSLKNSLSSVHLTNDAVQKLLPDYGKYEKGNKLSYDDFEKYLEKEYKGKYSFYKTIYPQMRKIAYDSMRASALLIDQDRKGHNFEIFGFDFMIDANFHPWLIQINTNPCLQLTCPVLMDVILGMVQNALKIGVDSILPPPYSFTEKRSRFSDNVLEENKFQLLYDSNLQQDQLRKLYQSGEQVKLNYKQLEKDEDEVYEDDGVQLQD